MNTKIIKAVKFKKIFSVGISKVLIIPDLWLRDMDWTTETQLVLEYHPYSKEIIIHEDTLNLAPKKEVQKDSELEVEVE